MIDTPQPDTTTSEAPQPRVALIVREGLPLNLSTNAGAVLGATLGARVHLPLGADATDGSGTVFRGIVTTPIPVLVADAAGLTELLHKANSDNTVEVSCLTEVARQARSYESYLKDLAAADDADADIVALCLAGPRNSVTKLTKRLPLLGDGTQTA
jgi:hypothetical protein